LTDIVVPLFLLMICYGVAGHATCQFQKKMWVIGGRSAEYQTFNLQSTERNADVWYTSDGGR